jgi:hypothetical protein
MDLASVEQLILARFKERCDRAGGVQPGYGMRFNAIRHGRDGEEQYRRALAGMVEKGWLKVNEAGTWYFLTEDGAVQVAT